MPFRRNIDIDLLRSFVTIVEVGSFTRAAERLLRTQSAISLQMKRLEGQVGSELFQRGGRGVKPTQTGDMLLGYARRILAANDELVARLAEPEVEGVVRLGAPEDFATIHLSGVLARFARAFPRVALEVTCDLSLNLLDRFEEGHFDLLLAKREPAGGVNGNSLPIWREPLVWTGATAELIGRHDALPLIAAPSPCLYRKRGVDALNESGLTWRMAYVSPSLAGAQAAVAAGLGVAVLPRAMIKEGMRVLGPETGLPELSDVEVALLRRQDVGLAANRLGDFIVSVLEGAQ